jgi:transposase
MRGIDPRRLVFLDESGANLAIGRSHAWLPRGAILVELWPMNWSDNLTMVGAIRIDRWLALGMYFGAINRVRFVAWIRRRLVPRLLRGDIVLLDNLPAHQARQVADLVTTAGATLKFLPLYSHDLNSIEPGLVFFEKRIRTVAPRTGAALRRTAQRSRSVIRPRHCQNWFAQAGYQLK